MPFMGPRVRATALAGLASLLGKLGGPSLPELLARVDVPATVLSEKRAYFELAAYARLLDECARATGEECFGLEFGRVFPVGGTGLIGHIMRSAPDFREFSKCLQKYLPIQVDDLRFVFEDRSPIARLAWVLPDDFLAPRKQLQEFLLTLPVTRIRLLFDPDFAPFKIDFPYREPASCPAYSEIFGSLRFFESKTCSVSFRSDILARPNRMPDPSLFATLCELADDQIVAIERSQEGLKGALGRDLLTLLANHLVQRLGNEEVSLDSAAKAMGRSPQWLQAELRRRDTSFAAELSRVRRSLADRYLRDTTLPMSEIAFLLGFSELSAFTRAARGWFGSSPTQYRQDRHDVVRRQPAPRRDSPDED